MCNKKQPLWWDTYKLAAAAAFPIGTVPLFNQSIVQKGGKHLTNNPEGGRLSAGHSMRIKGLQVAYSAMAKADAAYIQQNWVLEIVYNNSIIFEGQPGDFPQTGGVWGIEGADGAISNGVPSWASTFFFDAEDQFDFVAGESFDIHYLANGPAQNAASAVHLRTCFMVDWTRP